MPKISVIVPVYNVEKYLPHCVDSILEQTFFDLEVILVDDGSTDRCGVICDEYAAKDNRVIVIHGVNSGVSAARNKGIDLSRGEYISFVDGDDILDTNYYEILYNAIVENNVLAAACRIGRFSTEVPAINELKDTLKSIIPYEEFFTRQICGEIEISVCSRLFHRSIFEEVRFVVNRRYEDILFVADLWSTKLRNVAYIDLPLYYYRQQADSFMNHQVILSKCNPDRVFAASYLVERARKVKYKYMDECFAYAVKYPWFFVDSIYVHFRFQSNKKFLNELQKFLRNNYKQYQHLILIDNIQRKRMLLFARSKILYGFNAYARLFRVYLYHVFKLDAYTDGHGI